MLLVVAKSTLRGKGINPVKSEPLEFGDCDYEMSELEALAMEMQGLGKVRKEQEETVEPLDSGDKELDEGFWEELFSVRFEGDSTILSAEVGEDEDVVILADRLGYFGSGPK